MPIPPALRSFVPLAAGLLIGGAGVKLFADSQPGAEGTPEAAVTRLETELKSARNRITELEASGRTGRPGRTLTDGLRDLADDIRAGRPVSPDDIFRQCQPLIGTLAPLFERIRVREAEKMADSLAGEMIRRYGLDPAQQATLKQWFKQKAEDDAKAWTDLVSRKGTSLQDLAKEARNVRPDRGLDSVMEPMLTGDKLATFKTQRATEKAERIQRDADMRVERIDGIVGLDAGQRDQVFGIMARQSPDYDSSVKLEGAAGDIAASGKGTPEEATLAVLRPDQREKYLAEKQHRREEAAKDLQAIGLTLPPNWDPLDP
ncbi:hypothetical protein KBB96_16060 [Luteolibacter ambystomatis]|uniref:Uncharacterized protein n=1 Tax=Luteolibacter ambystomatis TaxID=2824561 RepID=A0A975IYG6_9BACT|nr:hypothetical protein [Luteolibacter ambystomatis]QUE50371.1 hypothetical protein KBB96_16060 [Luteolibacter ambystomatis]